MAPLQMDARAFPLTRGVATHTVISAGLLTVFRAKEGPSGGETPTGAQIEINLGADFMRKRTPENKRRSARRSSNRSGRRVRFTFDYESRAASTPSGMKRKVSIGAALTVLLAVATKVIASMISTHLL
jgi:hypothetical protein